MAAVVAAVGADPAAPMVYTPPKSASPKAPCSVPSRTTGMRASLLHSPRPGTRDVSVVVPHCRCLKPLSAEHVLLAAVLRYMADPSAVVAAIMVPVAAGRKVTSRSPPAKMRSSVRRAVVRVVVLAAS